MKGMIIRMKVYTGVMDFTHGFGFAQQRVLIPEQENLMLWRHQGTPYVGQLPADVKNYEVVGDIEVPEDVVERARQFKRLSVTLAEDVRALLGDE
jgi:hypothetical protein